MKNKLGLKFGYILFTNLCFMQQSLSVTTDHDPVAGFPLTPKKAYHLMKLMMN